MICRETKHTAVAEMTFSEFCADYGVNTHERNRENLRPKEDRESSMRRDPEWYFGLRSIKQAADLLANGWREGVARLVGCANDIAPPQAKSRKRRVTWRDEGDDLSVDRALKGEWDSAWRASRREWVAGPSHVTLFAPFGGHCGRTPDELFWTGAAALVLADKLEAAGYPVRLVGTSAMITSARGAGLLDHRAMRVDVILKESTEPVRIDALASVLCHAGVFRTFGISAHAAIPGDVGYLMGQPRGINDLAEQFTAGNEMPEGALVLPPVTSREACISTIHSTLANLESQP